VTQSLRSSGAATSRTKDSGVAVTARGRWALERASRLRRDPTARSPRLSNRRSRAAPTATPSTRLYR